MSTRASTRAKLEQALSRLIAGQPTITDGRLNVSNLCKEAGVGRDSFYRTDGLAEKLSSAQNSAQVHRPEVLSLRGEVTDLNTTARKVATEHRTVVADLERVVQTYANQIQALALANETLAEENRQLREHLERRDPDVIQLAERR